MNIFNEDNLCSHCTFEPTCEFHNEKPNHTVIVCDEYQMNQTVNIGGINFEFKPCNKLNPYLQWEHIALWHFRFQLMLNIRKAMGDI